MYTSRFYVFKSFTDIFALCLNSHSIFSYCFVGFGPGEPEVLIPYFYCSVGFGPGEPEVLIPYFYCSVGFGPGEPEAGGGESSADHAASGFTQPKPGATCADSGE